MEGISGKGCGSQQGSREAAVVWLRFGGVTDKLYGFKVGISYTAKYYRYASQLGWVMSSSWKRLRLRFRLSTLLLIITVLCIWLGRWTYIARHQRNAIEIITKAEGHVIFGYEEDSQGKRIPNPTPPAPKWLRDAIVEDYFRSPIIVDFATNLGRRQGSEEPKATPEALAALGELRGIHSIELSHNETVNDESLKWLAGLRKLRVLYLYNTAVTGSGLAYLSGLPLEHLDLSHSPVTDEGLRGILHLRRLRSLGLKNTVVTDQGLIHLVELPNLKDLRLAYTNVSDVGLEQLHQLSSLESVSLRGTNVTAKGVSALAMALPKCQISADYGLGLVPDQDLLFRDGYRPTTVEIKAKLKERNIGFSIDTDKSRQGNPITSFRLEESTLGAQPILQLVLAMPELEMLSIQNSLAGDTLLPGLAECKQLNCLIIRGGRLSDDGLRHLNDIPSLREIEFHNQVFTDNAVEHLSKLQQLTSLYLEESKLSDDGRHALESALPRCRLNLR
ncbi:MAG: hypothetical protein WD468_09740 [Pirellulales bacterium]